MRLLTAERIYAMSIPFSLLLAGVLAGYLYALTPGSAHNPAPNAFHAWNKELDATPDEQYLKDRARKVVGQGTGTSGESVTSSLYLVDSLSIPRTLFAMRSIGIRALRDFVLPLDASGITDHMGKFAMTVAYPGNKRLYLIPRGNWAPLRIEEVIVMDGSGAYVRDVRFKPAKTRAVHVDVPEETSEVLALYAGWWPTTAIIQAAKGATFGVEWRDPDGFPSYYVVLGRDGAMLRLLDASQTRMEESASPIALSVLPCVDWGQIRITGLPDYVDSVSSALRVLLNGELLSDLNTRDGSTAHGKAVIRVETGYLPIIITSLEDSCKRSEYADKYGELAVALPHGRYLVASKTPFGGLTSRKGIFVSDGGQARVELSRADRVSDSMKVPHSIVGFATIRKPSGSVTPAKGVVVCQSLTSHTGWSIKKEVVGENGVFTFTGLTRGARYDLIYWGEKDQDSERIVRQCTVPIDPEDRETVVNFDLIESNVRIDLPPRIPFATRLILADPSGQEGSRVFLDARGRKAVVISCIEEGSYKGQLWHSGQRIGAMSRPVEIRRERCGDVFLSESWILEVLEVGPEKSH